jgi:hypothetical protein
MTIVSGLAQQLLAFKQYLMCIGKNKKMVGTGVREFQYKIFVNPLTREPTNPHGCTDDKKYTKCRGTVGQTRVHEE